MTEASLSLVPTDTPDAAADTTDTPDDSSTSSIIPSFEGQEVINTKAKVTSVAALEIGDRVFRMDESVKMIVHAHVIGIHHVPNSQGQIERLHILKVMDSLVVSWDMDMDALRDAIDE